MSGFPKVGNPAVTLPILDTSNNPANFAMAGVWGLTSGSSAGTPSSLTLYLNALSYVVQAWNALNPGGPNFSTLVETGPTGQGWIGL